MESSQRDIFIDMVVHGFITRNIQIALSPCFILKPKKGGELPKTGVIFNCFIEM